MSRKPWLWSLLLIVPLLLAGGCSSNGPERQEEQATAEELYQQARRQLENGNYTMAVETLERLQGRFPLGPSPPRRSWISSTPITRPVSWNRPSPPPTASCGSIPATRTWRTPGTCVGWRTRALAMSSSPGFSISTAVCATRNRCVAPLWISGS